jgi:hypothetical protein
MGQGRSTVDETVGDSRIVEKARADLLEGFSRPVAELDRRRHAFTDVRLRVRRHAMGAPLTMVAICAAGIAPVVLRIWRSHRRRSVRARAVRLRDTIGHVVDGPEGIVVEPPVVQRAIIGAGSAVVAFLTRAALERLRSSAHRETPA